MPFLMKPHSFGENRIRKVRLGVRYANFSITATFKRALFDNIFSLLSPTPPPPSRMKPVAPFNQPGNVIIVVGDRMFLWMHDFDFCPNLIKFTQFVQICLKKLLEDAVASSAPTPLIVKFLVNSETTIFNLLIIACGRSCFSIFCFLWLKCKS